MRGNTAFTDEVVYPALAELTGLPEAASVPLAKFRHLTSLAPPPLLRLHDAPGAACSRCCTHERAALRPTGGACRSTL